MNDIDKRLRALEDIEEIQKLKHKSWMYYDTQNAEELLKLFTDDVRISTAPPAANEFRGKEQLAQGLARDFAVSIASHQGHGPVIDLTSETTATAYWSIDEWYYYFDRGLEWRAKGHYIDEYVKLHGEWKIQGLTVKFNFKESFERNR